MHYFHTYCVIITILFVYVIKNNCFDEFDKEGKLIFLYK